MKWLKYLQLNILFLVACNSQKLDSNDSLKGDPSQVIKEYYYFKNDSLNFSYRDTLHYEDGLLTQTIMNRRHSRPLTYKYFYDKKGRKTSTVSYSPIDTLVLTKYRYYQIGQKEIIVSLGEIYTNRKDSTVNDNQSKISYHYKFKPKDKLVSSLKKYCDDSCNTCYIEYTLLNPKQSEKYIVTERSKDDSLNKEEIKRFSADSLILDKKIRWTNSKADLVKQEIYTFKNEELIDKESLEFEITYYPNGNKKSILETEYGTKKSLTKYSYQY